MKLRNKKTGQEGNFIINKDHFECVDLDYVPEYRNLAELNEEWEDYEEPKKYWLISPVDADVEQTEMDGDEVDTFNKQIGNYFETKEEAEKAVERLRAWKRLKDKGFKFNGVTPMEYFIRFTYDKSRQILDNQQHPEIAQQFNKDLDLLFGGEE